MPGFRVWEKRLIRRGILAPLPDPNRPRPRISDLQALEIIRAAGC
jgi:hypothetical protein